MSGLKRTSPGYCVRCGKTHKTEKAALKCLAQYMKDKRREAKSESVRALAQELREAVELVDKKKAQMAVKRVEKDLRPQSTDKAREASYEAKELLDIAAEGNRVSLKALYKKLSLAVSRSDQPTLWQDVLAIFHEPAKF